MKCTRCNEKGRKVVAKNMCQRCYYATKRGYETYEEQLKKRNYIENGVGILTDRKGNKWEIDVEDFERCSREFWTDNGSGYAKSQKAGYLHKMIAPQWKYVDHVDRNPGNNRRDNLRDGGNGINCLNKQTTARSGHKGVHPSKGKWQARPQRQCLGTFNTKEEARDKVLEWAEEKGLTQFYII